MNIQLGAILHIFKILLRSTTCCVAWQCSPLEIRSCYVSV